MGLEDCCHRCLPGVHGFNISCKKKVKIWLWGLNFKFSLWQILAKQPINVVLVIMKVCNALIYTSLAVKGLFHLANFIIANLEQALAPIIAQALAHSFVTKCHSRKHWNNLFWLVYGSNNKELYWVYLFCKHMSVLRYDFEFNNILFPKNCFQSKSVFILKVIKAHFWIF